MQAVATSPILRARLRVAHRVADLLMNKMSIGSWAVRKRIAHRLSSTILPETYPRILCPTVLGYDVVMEKTTSLDLYRCGWYEIGTLDVFKQVLREGDVFVDAGASIGVMTFYAAKCVGPTGKVLSFEPTPLRYCCLLQSIAHNRVSNIKAFNFGLGEEVRNTTIFMDRLSPSMIAKEGSTAGIATHVEPLSAVLARESVERVRMIKIDVEGFELEVLKGCEDVLRSPEPPVLCVEQNDDPAVATAVAEFRRSLDGYRLCRLSKTKDRVSELVEWRAGEYLRRGDNIFCIPVGVTLR